jgi:hypothetical protein
VTVHYHGTPINPLAVLYELAGCHFCVSHARPDQIRHTHEIGQSLMLDNGAFSTWKRGYLPEWSRYYAWVERHRWPTDWAVIPDVINGGPEANDAMLAQWPLGFHGAPVWHLDEPIRRLLQLADDWPRLCVGSAGVYREIRSEAWERRMDLAFNALCRGSGRLSVWVHGLRMMACAGARWPLSSVDSADVARNHNRPQNGAGRMARRWDAMQCDARWQASPEQFVLPLIREEA